MPTSEPVGEADRGTGEQQQSLLRTELKSLLRIAAETDDALTTWARQGPHGSQARAKARFQLARGTCAAFAQWASCIDDRSVESYIIGLRETSRRVVDALRYIDRLLDVEVSKQSPAALLAAKVLAIAGFREGKFLDELEQGTGTKRIATLGDGLQRLSARVRVLLGDEIPNLERTSGTPVAAARTCGPLAEQSVEFLSNELARCHGLGEVRTIKGEKRVWLLRAVVEKSGGTVAWKELLAARHRYDGLETEQRMRHSNRSGRDVPMPRTVLRIESLRRLGRHIRDDLGNLKGWWGQDGAAAWWTGPPPTRNEPGRLPRG